jgi:hypothetical protein
MTIVSWKDTDFLPDDYCWGSLRKNARPKQKRKRHLNEHLPSMSKKVARYWSGGELADRFCIGVTREGSKKEQGRSEEDGAC